VWNSELTFLPKITELPGCERSLSRCRGWGRRFRAGWTVNQGQSTGGRRRARRGPLTAKFEPPR
jgi:hypothetical protein